MLFKEWQIPCREMVLLIRRVTVGGTVKRFAVVLLALVENRLLPITRYDTAHGYAHRDVIGLTEGKDFLAARTLDT